jgi:hypothetical protein
VISLGTHVLARAIATEVDADAATAGQQRLERELIASGRPLFAPVTVVGYWAWWRRGWPRPTAGRPKAPWPPPT